MARIRIERARRSSSGLAPLPNRTGDGAEKTVVEDGGHGSYGELAAVERHAWLC
jgi:hypothetical protein